MGKRTYILPVVMLAGMLALSGCSTLRMMGRGAYDTEARKQCDQEPTQDARRACYDRLDKARQERDSRPADGEDKR